MDGTENGIKTFRVESKGRKYFNVVLGKGAKAKLIINEASEDLEPGMTVSFLVRDLSERTRFGTDLKFEPIAKVDAQMLANLRHQKEAQMWLERAEEDVRKGRYPSRAITEATYRCQGREEYRDRLKNLQENIKALQENIRQQEALRWLRYAEEDAKKGLSSTRAIKEAFERCEPDPAFKERIEALREMVQKNKDSLARARGGEAARKASRVLFPVSDLPPVGQPMRFHGKAVVFESFGKPFVIDENAPSLHGSHLLGHEGEMGRYAYYREATPEEAAALQDQEARLEEAHQEARRREALIREIASLIEERGERPEGMNVPEGERVLDTSTVHGGGEWFVIGDDYIWYVRNNGADGDFWEENNVRTGGAGAIGWRIPYDTQIADLLEDLEAKRMQYESVQDPVSPDLFEPPAEHGQGGAKMR